MRLAKYLNIDPLVAEVCDDLYWLRRKQPGRAPAIEEIRNRYATELDDVEDRCFVLVGIALGLCKDCELTKEAADDALSALPILAESRCEHKKALSELEKLLLTPECYGPEKSHIRRIYDPGWKTGDTFCHLMASDCAERVGFKGKYILLRKCGEYDDHRGYHVQLVYVTVCSEAELPANAGDIEKLGWIQMMPGGGLSGSPDYLAQICIKSRTQERSLAMTYLGNFPILSAPDDHVPRDVRIAMPFHGIAIDGVIDYERTVCMRYKAFGIHHNK